MMGIGVLAIAHTPTVGVVGAHGGLGRELVQQCLIRDVRPVAFTRRPADPIYPPTPYGGLEPVERTNRVPFRNVPTYATDAHPLPPLDAIVFCMSGAPFRDDTSTRVVEKFAARLPTTTRACLVSAWGVGDSVAESNVGIQLMRSWYLRSTYEAKERQEAVVVSTFRDHQIVRPTVLSYAPLPTATTRADLAHTILDWCVE